MNRTQGVEKGYVNHEQRPIYLILGVKLKTLLTYPYSAVSSMV
jgi:hypothetical protein